MGKDIAIGGLGLGSISTPVKPDNVANGYCCDVSVSPGRYTAEMGLATRYASAYGNTASIVKI